MATTAGGGFSFGGLSGSTPAAAAAAAAATAAPNDAGGGTATSNLFGGGNASATTTATTATATTNNNSGVTGAAASSGPATGFSFGGSGSCSGTASTQSTATTAAPPTPGFGFGGGGGTSTSSLVPSATTTTTVTATATAATTPRPLRNPNNLIEVPEFPVAFPNLQVLAHIKKLCTKITSSSSSSSLMQEEAQLAGQELCYILQVQPNATNSHSGTPSSLSSSSSSSSSSLPIVGSQLSNPQLLEWKLPDLSLRQKLQSHPIVFLQKQLAEAPMTKSMMEDVLAVADDLRIYEPHAISLYAYAASSQQQQQQQQQQRELVNQEQRFLDRAFANDTTSASPELNYYDKRPIAKLARDLYFMERHAGLSTLLYLLQSRLSFTTTTTTTTTTDSSHMLLLLQATDGLIQNDLVFKLVTFIRESTHRIVQLQQELLLQQETATPNIGSLLPIMATTSLTTNTNNINSYPYNYYTDYNNNNNNNNNHNWNSSTNTNTTTTSNTFKTPKFAKVHLFFAQLQRQTAIECLFYLAYQTQLTEQEICAMIDLIRDLTNGIPDTTTNSTNYNFRNNHPSSATYTTSAATSTTGLQLFHPFVDVPNPYEQILNPLQQQSSSQQQQDWTSTFSSMNYTIGKEKEALEWQKELIFKTWNSGKVHLLHCVSPLILTVICSLDSKQQFLNRHLHGPNTFGVGNQLLPPGDTTASGLRNIHARLGPDAADSGWARKDIWGLLAASYALLLRSEAPATVLSSPRPGGPKPPVIDARSASQKCFGRLPSNLKSFTFARLSLAPSLQRYYHHDPTTTTICDNSEFFLSVLAEFVSNYLNVLMISGDMPISRSRWEKDQEEELRLRRLQQEQQRQFLAWSGTTTINNNNIAQEEDEEIIPSSVDIMKRPDCMDDILALATCMCSLGPEYSQFFWTKGSSNSNSCSGFEYNHTEKWIPSRTLHELERIQTIDPSLESSYLAFLAALACSEQGSTVVHELLSRKEDAFTTTTSTSTALTITGTGRTTSPGTSSSSSSSHHHSPVITWSKIMDNLCWYARELSPFDNDGVSSSSNASSSSSSPNSRNTSSGGGGTSSSSGTSTSYYYDNNNYNQRSSTQNADAYFYSSTGNPTSTSASSSSSSSAKPKELGEQNSARLSSYLALLINVASYSATARCALLSMNMPANDANKSTASSNNTATGGGAGGTTTNTTTATSSDSKTSSSVPSSEENYTLLVLFSLAIAPLSPELRGATMTAISCLFQLSNTNYNDTTTVTTEQANQIRDMALLAWEFLESCQLLPIALIDQYPQVVLGEKNPRINMAFPPSSITLAAGGNANAVFPPDPMYGLIYEMEHVESKIGWYPSTEGFLKLLVALISAAGCPSRIGQAWRIRTGCAPYVEYVMDFVLPRASKGSYRSTSFRKMSLLPFRVRGDQSRLISHALSVVEAVLTRYSVPSKQLKTDPGSNASTILGMKAVAENVVKSPNQVDEKTFADDYRNNSVSQFQPQGPFSNDQRTSTSGASVPAIPSPKSPGFAVLADILSADGGTIFPALVEIILEHGGHRGITSFYGMEADRAALTYAMFGETPPTLSSAKTGAKQSPSSKPLQSFLKPILPYLGICQIDQMAFDDAVFWREKSIGLAFQILCATAAREHAFHAAVLAAKEPLKIVPLLRFEKKRIEASRMRIVDVQLSRLTNLLYSSEFANQIRASIIEYIGYIASNPEQDIDIASGALALVYFAHQTLAPPQRLMVLCGSGTESEHVLAGAAANRIVASSRRPESRVDAQVIGLILTWILSELRSGAVVSSSRTSLAQVLLGVPSATKGGNWKPGNHFLAGKPRDCFDAILELLKDVSFVTGRTTAATASCCFEILFRLYDLIKARESLAYRIVLYTAERLRAVEFWRTFIALLFSDQVGNGSSTLQTAAVNRSSGDEFVIHSIAWFLKAVSYELRLLVGFSDAGGLGLQSDLAGFLAPRPLQSKILLSFLFRSPFLAKKVICDLPLDRITFDTDLPVPPKEAIRAAVISLPGPVDITDGYEQVKGSTLVQYLKAQNRSFDEAAFRKWADEWNSLAAWDCASSHLTNAFYIMLGSALKCTESLRSDNLWTDASLLERGGANKSLESLQASELADMLVLLLRRLLNDESPDRHRGMDSMLFLTASRNLSSAVLILCQEMVDRIDSSDPQQAPDGADVVTVTVLLTQALVSSGLAEMDCQIKQERTTVLGSALTILVRHLVASEPNMVAQHLDELVAASEALSILSCYKATSTSPPTQSAVAIFARSCLASLIDSCGDELALREDSFVYRILSQRFLKGLTSLAAALDEDISNLLKVIALQRFGGEILLNAGILGALLHAAEIYMVEENRIQSQLQGRKASFQKYDLGIPQFLKGHIQFLTVLMSSPHLARGLCSDISMHVLEIMGRYKNVVHRLCGSFPLGADVLRLFLTCLVQAASMSQPIKARELLPGQLSDFERIFTEGGFIENGILMLSSQLWENPLPSSLLPPLPKILRGRSKLIQSSMVPITSEQQHSWWHALDQFLDQEAGTSQFAFEAPRVYYVTGAEQKWNETKYEYSIAAIDLMNLCMSLLKRSDSLEVIDGISIAIGICRCADAASAIETRLNYVLAPADAMDTSEEGGNKALEAEYLQLLGTKLAHSVMDLLVIALMKHRALNQQRPRNRSDRYISDFSKQVSLSLDHSGLDVKGLGCIDYSSDSEGDKAFVQHICKQLRIELNGNQ